MKIIVAEEPHLSLDDYQNVPISFRVSRVLELVPAPPGTIGLLFRERPVARPYLKEYDQPGHRPTDWGTQWDLSTWGIFAARFEGRLIGCAAVAWNSPQVHFLEGRKDIAALWDIRVAPEFRGKGAGAALFQAAVDWSRARHLLGMKVETQSINLDACRFYASRGCDLVEVDTRAYPELPDETMMVWYLKL